jgi:flavin reductase (DIM6/NTAB) family NADH-FMN oxidoreductase RutF
MKDVFEVSRYKLEHGGLLLTSIGRDGRFNVMTIGWGLMGIFWREPVFMVAVRPTRYTYRLIKETNEFTVNIPRDGMDEIVAYCGKASGKDVDKIKERRLTIMNGKRVNSPIISHCIAHFECKVIGKSKVIPELLSEKIKKRSYSTGNYHTLYFGNILSILKDDNELII